MARNILLEISPLDTSTNEIVTLRLASASASIMETLLDGEMWTPCITAGPQIGYSTWGSGQPKALDVTYGQITFAIVPALNNINWAALAFNGCLATVWIGLDGQDFSMYRRLFTGLAGPLARDNNQSANIPLLGAESSLARNLLSASYSGTGGAEGISSLLGTLKPMALGQCTSVLPTLIDSTYLVYQYHGYGTCPVYAVYEGGIAHGAPTYSTTTYSDLIAAPLDNTLGQWASCPTLGMFRLGNKPTGKISADVGAPATVGQIASTMIQAAGLSTDKIDAASFTSANRRAGIYVTDQTQIIDAVRDLAMTGGRYLIADPVGKFHLANQTSTKTPIRITAGMINQDAAKAETPADPVYRVKVGHTHVWGVHSADEVLGGVQLIAANAVAANAAAEAAQETANLGAADAAYAKARVVNQALDGVLDRTEKLSLVREIEAYTAERTGLLSSAQGFGITAEATAYSQAYAALMAYLTGLSPAYDDTSADTVIDGPTYVAKRDAYLDTRTKLEAAIAYVTARLANWPDITGPGKPEDGATVGAPSGTAFGTGTVDQHLTDVEAANIAFLTSQAQAELARIRDRALNFTSPDGASIYTLHQREETARQDADQAFTEVFDLLGAVTPDGTAFVLNDSTVQTTKTVAGATVYQSVSSRFAASEGQIETINQTFSDAEGTISRALLRVDADGRVIGFAATNDGHEGSFIVTADKFQIVSPDDGKAYFDADSTGKVVMHDVEVDTIKIGAVGYAEMQLGAAQKASWYTLASDITVPDKGTNTVAQLDIFKEDQDSILKIQMYCKVKSPDDLQFTGTIAIDGTTVDVTTVNIVLDTANSAGQMPITPVAYVPGIAAGAHSVTFTLLNSEVDNVGLTAQAGSTLEVVELRKASIGSTTGSGAALPPVDPVTGDQRVAGGGSGGDGGYGGGGACPVPSMRILVANTDRTGPGDKVAAGDLQPGDWVWTQHETSREWGAFQVVAVRIVTGSPIYRTTMGATTIDTSASHLFDLGGGWTRADTIGRKLGTVGDVVAITVAKAHTYVVEGILSHNKSAQQEIE